MSSRTQSRALPWFGSDASVAAQYAARLADCKHVTVPFCGGLSVVAHLVKTAKEIVCNDRHALAMNFYSTLSDPETREQLVADLRETPFHETVLIESQEICKRIGQDGWIELTPRDVAKHYFITCWMGRSGKAGTDAEFDGKLAMRWDAGGGSSPKRFQSAVDSIEHVWGPICERCSFLCRDWSDILENVKDDPRCGLYLDPPWVEAGNSYVHKFDENEHRKLAGALRWFRKATVVIRYGDHPLIRELYSGWNVETIASRNQSNNEVDELCITR